jgi:hypothetical protein
LIPVNRFSMRDGIPRCGTGLCKFAHRDAPFRPLITVNGAEARETTLRAVATATRACRAEDPP